jgi:hypothetical protein
MQWQLQQSGAFFCWERSLVIIKTNTPQFLLLIGYLALAGISGVQPKNNSIQLLLRRLRPKTNIIVNKWRDV